LAPQYTINNNRLTINLEHERLTEVEIILPDQRRIIYGLTNYCLPMEQLTTAHIKELIPVFLQHKRVHDNLLKTTVSDYEKRITQFCNQLTGEHVTADDWLAYYDGLHRRLKPITVRNYYRNLNVFAEWLTQAGHIPNNPLGEITPPKPTANTLPKAISAPDIRKMIGAANCIRDKAILLFFWDSGCRATEAAGMVWGDIQLKDGTATVIGKGDKSRPVFFCPEITGAVMAAYRETVPHTAGNAVFVGKQGPMTYSGLYQVFARIAERAGIPDSRHNPHAWRHAFGRDTTLSGIPTGVLQKLMGHESIETTKIYLGFTNDNLKDAHRKHSPVSGFDSIGKLIVQS